MEIWRERDEDMERWRERWREIVRDGDIQGYRERER